MSNSTQQPTHAMLHIRAKELLQHLTFFNTEIALIDQALDILGQGGGKALVEVSIRFPGKVLKIDGMSMGGKQVGDLISLMQNRRQLWIIRVCVEAEELQNIRRQLAALGEIERDGE